MPIVPADERGRADDPILILSGNAEPAVTRRSGGKDDRVVAGAQVGDGDIAADLDVAEVTNLGPERRPVEYSGDVLGRLIVGRHAKGDEPERRRQALENVDANVEAGLK